jgi:hypothetical protein
LRNFQISLGLKSEDVEQIERPILIQREAEYRQKREAQQQRQREEQERLRHEQEKLDYQRNLQRYEQEFRRAIEAEYPLSDYAHDALTNFQQILGLRDEDIDQIERPILAQREAEYQRKREVEQQRQREDQERLRREQETLEKPGTSSKVPLPLVQPQSYKSEPLNSSESASKNLRAQHNQKKNQLFIVSGIVFSIAVAMGGYVLYQNRPYTCVCNLENGCESLWAGSPPEGAPVLEKRTRSGETVYSTGVVGTQYGAVLSEMSKESTDDWETVGFVCSR